jgi:Tetracyclin repressor-like, C-terminal domain
VGLIADALAERAADALPVPDTGDIAADLRALARGAARRLQAPRPGDQSRMILVTAAANPELAQIASAYWAQRFAAVGGRVRTAVAAGQLPEATDPAAVVRAIAAPLFFRVLVTHEPLTEAVADRVAAIALKLAREGLLAE